MSTEQLVAQLIIDNEWDAATQILSKRLETSSHVKTLSLLYRYNNQFEQEKQVISQAQESSSYIKQRRDYFNKSIWEQLEPRQKLYIPKDFTKVPTLETLEQLCFVTAAGSDHPYFSLVWQLIESLKNTSTYKDIPIMVFDAGLTDDDKQKLLSTFSNITIVDPGWDVEINMNATRVTQAGLKGCTARPYMDKHFQGYRYYMWLDTDVWIQDERALDSVVKQAEEEGVGCVQDHLYDNWQNSFWDMNNRVKPIVPKDFSNFLTTKKTVTGGTFCIDKQSGFFEKWQAYFKLAIDECGFTWGSEEITFLYTVNKMLPKIQPISRVHQFSGCRNGFPIIHEKDQILYTPDSNQIIGIVHLTGFLSLKNDPFIPVVLLPRDQFVPVNHLEQNKQIFNQWLAAHKQMDTQHQINVFENTKMTSFHFRTYPWKDKSAIREELFQNVKAVLAQEA